MSKIDYKKELKHLYRPSAKKVEAVDVPRMNFLMIDGKGDPNTSQEFKDAIGVLYPLSYILKFMIKKGESELIMVCYHLKVCGGPMTCLHLWMTEGSIGNGRL